MPLIVGENSYGTLEQAETYFITRLDSEAWSVADDAMKNAAMVTAAQVLDEEDWGGVAVSGTQLMAHPRKGSYLDPRLGFCVDFDGYPARLLKAQFETAYHFLNNDGLLDETGKVESLKISSVELLDIRKAATLPNIAYTLIRPMLVNHGSRIWWRAN